MNESNTYPTPEQVYRELLRNIGNYMDRVRLVALDSGIPPKEYTFELNIKSIADIRSDYSPLEKDKWLLKVRLPRRAETTPDCEFLSKGGFMKPFHPHVKPTFMGKGSWIDYKKPEPDETLLDLVLRICRSLQFDPNYIDTSLDTKHIGNEKALIWFKTIHEKSPDSFPRDKNVIEPVYQILPQSPSEHGLETLDQAEAINDKAASETPNIQSSSDDENLALKDEINAPLKKKFSISLATEPYRPKRGTKPNLTIEEELNSDVRATGLRNELYVLTSAREDLFNHIDWTAKSPENLVEQGGLLLGEVYFDEASNAHIGVVERAIAAKSAESSATHLSLSHNVWREMTEKIDEEMPDKQIIGWYHTHPNRLDVYMSEADLNTQRMMFPNDWQFAVILNPHRRIWRSFIGYSGVECQGFFVKKREDDSTNSFDQEASSYSEDVTEEYDTSENIEEENPNTDL